MMTEKIDVPGPFLFSFRITASSSELNIIIFYKDNSGLKEDVVIRVERGLDLDAAGCGRPIDSAAARLRPAIALWHVANNKLTD
ncbi:hypothetical protein EVAR_67607_1 [Eumeta japonica]|uniref:Uncharacterized protein n=1 Tax=Eumeta variegata TaxID=151549 RepID=A0A4C1ZT38_EUMVA|nr:hypothetical protein EVAR_67607_1 [Eumeta japonica]